MKCWLQQWRFMDKADEVRLRHMLDAVRDAVSFTTGTQRDTLDTNRMLTLSLVKCIEFSDV